MIANLYDAWKQSRALKYESLFHEPIVNSFCQWQSATDNGRDEKGRIFNAGYEVFIYAFFIGLYKNIIPSVDRKLSHSEMLMAEFGLNKQIKNTARPKEFRLSGFLKKVFPIKYIIIIIPDFEADGVKQVIAINDKIPMQEKIVEIFCDIFNFLKIHIKNSENMAICIPEVANK